MLYGETQYSECRISECVCLPYAKGLVAGMKMGSGDRTDLRHWKMWIEKYGLNTF